MILCSGGFSILHDGHIDYLEDARRYGRVYVALNSDAWVIRKYGFLVSPWYVRARVLKALKVVYDVYAVQDDDGTVCEAITTLHPMYFGNGGDRTTANEKEHTVCFELNVVEVFGLGGAKTNSSRSIIEEIRRSP